MKGVAVRSIALVLVSFIVITTNAEANGEGPAKADAAPIGSHTLGPTPLATLKLSPLVAPAHVVFQIDAGHECPPTAIARAESLAPRDPATLAAIDRLAQTLDRFREAREDDPARALARPLDANEEREARALIRALAGGASSERDAAAEKICARFGARAIPLLLDAQNDPDVERRFRARTLVRSILFSVALERAPGAGWLGVRWSAGPSGKHGFCVQVHESLQNEPAHRAGIRDGDDITEWDGVAIDDAESFIEFIQNTSPGRVALLTVNRLDQELRIPVTMGERDDLSRDPIFRRASAERLFERWMVAFRKAARRR